MVKMVVFDVGETLVDETRHWSEWADWLGITRFTFLAGLGHIIASGRHHRDIFPILTGRDYQQVLDERSRSGWAYKIVLDDFYPDAISCIQQLRADGLQVGVVGNQPKECEDCLLDLGIPIDLLGSSERWGVKKPDRQFFERLIVESGLRPGDICYVGDHPENDIAPAAALGIRTAFIKRGPWGFAFAGHTSAREADAQIADVHQLPEIVGGWSRRSSGVTQAPLSA